MGAFVVDTLHVDIMVFVDRDNTKDVVRNGLFNHTLINDVVNAVTLRIETLVVVAR